MLKQLDTLIGLAVVMSMVSVIIMTITQMISSILALRGRNLRDALEALFQKLSPGLTGARELAELVLKRPTLSDSMLSIKGSAPEAWKLASAIQPGECLEAVRRIATLDATQIQGSLAPKSHGLITNAQAAAEKVVAALGTSEAREAARVALVAADTVVKMAGVPPAEVDKIRENVNILLAEAAGSVTIELQRWSESFATVQSRAEQWFTMYTRRWTVILAFVLAFVLQLDVIQLVKRLSDDTDFRNAMVKLSVPVQTQVDAAINDKFAGTVYYAALKVMKATDTDVKTFEDPIDQKVMQAGAEAWLAKQAKSKNLSDDKTQDIIVRFQQVVQDQAKKRVEAAGDVANKVAGLYGQADLALIPADYPKSPGEWFGFTEKDGARHFLGMIAAAMLLTLGAPFWFNILKSLTNLRSAVAEQADKGAPAKPKN